MDILYFQGVRPFRLGAETIMDILFFQGHNPLDWGGYYHGHSFLPRGTTHLGCRGKGNYHGHPLLQRGTTL